MFPEKSFGKGDNIERETILKREFQKNPGRQTKKKSVEEKKKVRKRET